MSGLAPTATPGPGSSLRARLAGSMQRESWNYALWGLLVLLLILTKIIRPNYGAFDLGSLAIAWATAAMATGRAAIASEPRSKAP